MKRMIFGVKGFTILTVLAISAVVMCMVMLAGCGETVEVKDTNPLLNETDKEEVSGDETIFIWTDKETGVQYVVYREKRVNAGFGGITPRLNADGSVCTIDVTNEEQ